MIKIENLTKKFNKKTVLKDISINFENFTYALLGENGAGKTTLIRCITGLYSNYTGNISVVSSDKQIGYLPQTFGAFKELTVKEMMQFFANQKGLKAKNVSDEIENLVNLVNLSDKIDTKSSKLSGGMLKRLGIAQALLGNPETIILDEPTSGLDPEERLRFKNIIEKIKENKTIILSTHIVEDVDVLCDKLAIMRDGEIIKCCEAEDAAGIAEGKVYEVPESILKNYTDEYYVVKQYHKGNDLIYRILAGNFDSTYSVEPTIEDGYLCSIREI